MLLQIILIVTCCATKYYKNQKMTAKKILNQHCSEFRNSLQDNLYGERQDTLWSDDKRHTLKSVP